VPRRDWPPISRRLCPRVRVCRGRAHPDYVLSLRSRRIAGAFATAIVQIAAKRGIETADSAKVIKAEAKRFPAFLPPQFAIGKACKLRRSGGANAPQSLLRPKVLVRKHRFLGVLDNHRSLQRGLMAGVAGIGQMVIILGKLGFILVLDGDVELE